MNIRGKIPAPPVITVNNISITSPNNFISPFRDGLLINLFHGSKYGELFAISPRGNQLSTEISPDIIRWYLDYAFKLKTDKRLYLIPCYPKRVKERWPTELEENNIEVIGDWNKPTVVLTVGLYKSAFISPNKFLLTILFILLQIHHFFYFKK